MKTYTLRVKAKEASITCGSELSPPTDYNFPNVFNVQMPVDTGIIVIDTVANYLPFKMVIKLGGVVQETTPYLGSSTQSNQTTLDDFLTSEGLPTETIQDNLNSQASFYINKTSTSAQVMTIEFYHSPVRPDWGVTVLCPNPNVIPP